MKKILLDSNAYLRLAYHIHPLLGKSKNYGENGFCLYITKKVRKEIDKVSRFKNQKFDWVNEDNWKENRKNIIKTLKKEVKTGISNTINFLNEYISDLENDGFFQDKKGAIPSPIDIECLAYAQELDVFIITDDNNMCCIANEFEIKSMSTLELLKHMLDNNHSDITIKKIREIVCNWVFNKDLLSNCKSEYYRLFDEKFPDCWG